MLRLFVNCEEKVADVLEVITRETLTREVFNSYMQTAEIALREEGSNTNDVNAREEATNSMYQ